MNFAFMFLDEDTLLVRCVENDQVIYQRRYSKDEFGREIEAAHQHFLDHQPKAAPVVDEPLVLEPAVVEPVVVTPPIAEVPPAVAETPVSADAPASAPTVTPIVLDT